MAATTNNTEDLQRRYDIPDNLRPEIPVVLSLNSRQVFEKRYQLKRDGVVIETAEETMWRVAKAVACAEDTFEQACNYARDFYEMLASFDFVPNSPTFSGAGTALGQLAACFVLPISDDLGKEDDGIFQTLRNAALIQQTGGGNGFSFSRLRQKGARIKTSDGISSGPVGFLEIYDKAFGRVAQGGTRRGANMAVMRVDHPDIKTFVDCKQGSEDTIVNFNISAALTDDFMQAEAQDKVYALVEPHTDKVVEYLSAVDTLRHIATNGWKNGEPGVLFIDEANRHNPMSHVYSLESTNPCGEQWLGPYENCCLGSVNLANHMVVSDRKTPEGVQLWELDDCKFERTVRLATRFLDNVVTVNKYVPAVPQLKEAALDARRIGLGFMGFGDLLFAMGVRYGSVEGQGVMSEVCEWMRYFAMDESCELAREKGPFRRIKGSMYDPENVTWEVPHALNSEWGLPLSLGNEWGTLSWSSILRKIKAHGIRNACQTTVAPTGTIATVAGCEGYGCEPVFGLGYVRHVNDNGKDLELNYTSPLFLRALTELGWYDGKDLEIILAEVARTGSCASLLKRHALPPSFECFAVAPEITPEEHIYMQAAAQAFIDNSMSKTCNLPNTATVDDVINIIRLAWRLKCKGLTVYREGSRDKVVLETVQEKERKEALKQGDVAPSLSQTITDSLGESEGSSSADDEAATSSALLNEVQLVPPPELQLGWSVDDTVQRKALEVKCLRRRLGKETKMKRFGEELSNNHTLHVMYGIDDTDDEPNTCFIIGGKGGSELSACQEGLGRVIAMALSFPSELTPSRRLELIAGTLKNIGGTESYGMGKKRVLSMPDAVAKTAYNMVNYIRKRKAKRAAKTLGKGKGAAVVEYEPVAIRSENGQLCTKCGIKAVAYESGCRSCHNCGDSRC